MKIALLGTGFGQAHAAVYARHPDVHEVVVFGRTPQKLAKINEQFGFPTTTNLDGLITDPSVDLVDICLPRLQADSNARARHPDRQALSIDDAPGSIHVSRVPDHGQPVAVSDVSPTGHEEPGRASPAWRR